MLSSPRSEASLRYCSHSGSMGILLRAAAGEEPAAVLDSRRAAAWRRRALSEKPMDELRWGSSSSSSDDDAEESCSFSSSELPALDEVVVVGESGISVSCCVGSRADEVVVIFDDGARAL